jgi:hypothetical protein
MEHKQMKKQTSHDVTKESTRVTLPGAGTDEPGTALYRGGPEGTAPTAVMSPPSPTQPNASFPTRMHPASNAGPASQPVVPEGADMPAARRTAPAAPAPRLPAASPAMSHADIKRVAQRYAYGGKTR